MGRDQENGTWKKMTVAEKKMCNVPGECSIIRKGKCIKYKIMMIKVFRRKGMKEILIYNNKINRKQKSHARTYSIYEMHPLSAVSLLKFDLLLLVTFRNS